MGNKFNKFSREILQQIKLASLKFKQAEQRYKEGIEILDKAVLTEMNKGRKDDAYN